MRSKTHCWHKFYSYSANRRGEERRTTTSTDQRMSTCGEEKVPIISTLALSAVSTKHWISPFSIDYAESNEVLVFSPPSRILLKLTRWIIYPIYISIKRALQSPSQTLANSHVSISYLISDSKLSWRFTEYCLHRRSLLDRNSKWDNGKGVANWLVESIDRCKS